MSLAADGRATKNGGLNMNAIQLPEMTRRVFLSRTLQALGAAAAIPLAGCATRPDSKAAGAVATSGSTATVPALKFLTPGQYATLEAISDTIIPRGGAFELGAQDVGLAARIDSYLPQIDPAVAQGIRGALVFVEQQAPPLAGKTGPFSGGSEEERTAVCAAMLQAGGLPASVLLAMKYVSLGYFYTLDETWKYTGYDGPMLLEKSR
jgi:hypothetical protein